jgi:lipopolysaccharide transport system permease protein
LGSVYRVVPTWNMIFAPVFAMLAALLAFAVCLWLSAIDAMYRDARYALGFVIQLWYFGTPIIYPLSLVPEKWQFVFMFNPMAAFVLGFRWSMLGDTAPPAARLVVVAIAATVLLLVSGAFFFRRVEQRVVDMI